MIAAFDVQGIITIIGAVVAAVIAILEALKKQKYANAVRSMWTALDAASMLRLDPTDQDTPDNAKLADLLTQGATSSTALSDFVHEVINQYQRGMGPAVQKAKGLSGNTAMKDVIEKVVKP